ncbi:MAG: hypothetical protein JOZ18_04505 [Chloroflexi bacterium]|nr:hypothetical protein [Chloroflexota bacterium]
MSRSRDYIWQIALTLQRHGLISHVTEETILRACDRLRQEKGVSMTGGVFSVLADFVGSERVVERFDPEIDNCKEGAEVIQHYARATAGEWVPAYVFSTLVSNGEDGWTEAIDFDFQGRNFHWQFTTASGDGRQTNWVVSFYEQLDQFVKGYLKGDFFYPRVYEYLAAYYLPSQAVSDLTVIEEEMEVQFGLEGFGEFVEEL